MRVKNTDQMVKTLSQQRLFQKIDDFMKVSSNTTASLAHRSITAAHADPILGTSLLNSTSSQARRFIRASDDSLSLAVDKMQRIARLTTAIHIQLGLISGSIKPDDLVPELLHLGSVTPSQIINMDSAKLKSAMLAIKELPGKLKEDGSTKRVEEKLSAMNVIRDMVKAITDDVTKWPGQSEFEAEMNTLKTNGVDVAIPQHVHELVKSWNVRLSDIKKMKLDVSDPKSLQKADFYLAELNTFSTDLLAALATLISTADPKPWKYPKITSATDALSSIIHDVNLVEKAIENNGKLKPELDDTDHFNSYKATLQSLSGVSKTVTDASLDLQAISTVTQSRGSSVVKSPGFPGFSNGYSDIQTLLVDLTDAWLSQIADSKSMEAALKLLMGLMSAFEKVDKALGPVDAQKKAILNYFEYVNGIQRVPTVETEIDASVTKYQGCSQAYNQITKYPSIKPVKEFIVSTEKLDKAVGDVDINVQKLIELLNTPEVESALEEVKTLAQSSTDPAVLAQTVQKLTTSPTIVKLSTVLVAAEDFSFKKTTDNIKSIADEVLEKVGSVDEFQKSLNNYPVYFACLRNEIPDAAADAIRSVVGMAVKFRGGNQKVMTDGEAVVIGLLGSSEDFKSLGSSIENLKGKSSADTKRLELLPSPEKHSNVIGTATFGVSNMEKASEAKAQADIVILHSGVIEKQMQLATNPEEVKNLGHVVNLKSSLPALYQQLDVWKSGVEPSNSTVLASFSQLFTSAKSVSGITGDFGAMAKSVGELATKVTDPTDKTALESVQKALEELAKIDLNFASYSNQFDQSKDTLTALDLFFAALKTPKASATPGTKRPNGTSIQSTPSAFKQVNENLETTEAPSDSTVLIVVLAIGAVVCIGAAGGVVYWKKMKKDKSGNSNRTLPPPPEPPQSTPATPGSTPAPTKPKAPEAASIKLQAPDAPLAPDAPPALDAPPAPNASPAPPAAAPEVPAPAPNPNPVIEPTQRSEKGVVDVKFDYSAGTNFNKSMIANFNKYKVPHDLAEIEKVKYKWKDPEVMTFGEAMSKFFKGVMADIQRNRGEDQNKAIVHQHAKETKRRIPLLESTRVKLDGYGSLFTNDYYHASYVTFYTGLRMILAQSPMKASADKLSTIEKFWWMIRQHRTKFIVMLDRNTSGEQCDYYFPEDKGEEMKFNGLTVKCTDVSIMYRFKYSHVTTSLKRRLKVQFDNDKEFEVTHMQHLAWQADFAPTDAFPVIEILKTVRLSENPVVVHCTDGASRSGCFALIELGYQEMMLSGGNGIDFSELVGTLRSMRALAINHEVQLGFASLCIQEMLANGDCNHYETWYGDFRGQFLTDDQKGYTTRTKAGLDSIKKMFSGWLPKNWLKMESQEASEEVAVDVAENPELMDAQEEYRLECSERMATRQVAIEIEPIDNN